MLREQVSNHIDNVESVLGVIITIREKSWTGTRSRITTGFYYVYAAKDLYARQGEDEANTVVNSATN